MAYSTQEGNFQNELQAWRPVMLTDTELEFIAVTCKEMLAGQLDQDDRTWWQNFLDKVADPTNEDSAPV